jgi:hypothetical protein
MPTSDGTLVICGIAGSLRRGSYNRALLRAAQELAPDGRRSASSIVWLRFRCTIRTWRRRAIRSRCRLRFMNISPGSTVEARLENENGPVSWTALAVDGADKSDTLRVEGTQRLRLNAGQTFDFHWTPAAAGSVTLVLQHIFATSPGRT